MSLQRILTVAPERIWKWGHRSGAKAGAPILREAPEKNFFFDPDPALFCSKSTISRFGVRFPDGQYSLVSFLFPVLLLTVPPCPIESAPLILMYVLLCVLSKGH